MLKKVLSTGALFISGLLSIWFFRDMISVYPLDVQAWISLLTLPLQASVFFPAILLSMKIWNINEVF